MQIFINNYSSMMQMFVNRFRSVLLERSAKLSSSSCLHTAKRQLIRVRARHMVPVWMLADNGN